MSETATPSIEPSKETVSDDADGSSSSVKEEIEEIKEPKDEESSIPPETSVEEDALPSKAPALPVAAELETNFDDKKKLEIAQEEIETLKSS